MKTLRKAVADAREEHRAIGHFNISDSSQFNAITTAARELDVPVIVGVSEGEADFLGLAQAVALVRSIRETYGQAVYLNADHVHTTDGCKAAIDAGFDAVIFDGSKGSLEENIERTREVVAYARASGRDILVEGELGYIGSSSKLLDAVPEDVTGAMTDSEEAARFVRETGIDLLAPAVGNLHGMLKGRTNPALNIERVAALAEASGVPMVLHGGSGISDTDFAAAIDAGMAIVHINTEIRIAYRRGIEGGLAADADEIAPYRYFAPGVDAVHSHVTERLKLFSGATN